MLDWLAEHPMTAFVLACWAMVAWNAYREELRIGTPRPPGGTVAEEKGEQ
jgi:hypothetical protein